VTTRSEQRERLRLDLETYLRELAGLNEGWSAQREDWDARGPQVYMAFRDTRLLLHVAYADASAFEAWRCHPESPPA
jgi:hypothetical protein